MLHWVRQTTVHSWRHSGVIRCNILLAVTGCRPTWFCYRKIEKMSLEEEADFDPVMIEKYVVCNLEFFKRWTLNNITLNQLNAILIEQQMMPVSAAQTRRSSRVGFSEEMCRLGATTEKITDSPPGDDASPTVRLAPVKMWNFFFKLQSIISGILFETV